MAWLGSSLLHHVQMCRLFPFDSKHFVDMPIKTSVSAVLTEWEALRRTEDFLGARNVQELLLFVSKHFDEPGRDMDVIPLNSCNANLDDGPDFLKAVLPSEVSKFGFQVYQLWKLLHRKVSRDVVDQPQNHTMLPLPYPFIIPGDRFREVYYWDSYWIMLGLISCGLEDTAIGMTRNMLAMVDMIGHVPNGSRTYYLNRSQPPLLSSMVSACFQASGSKELLRDALPRLMRTWAYWMPISPTGREGSKGLLVAGRAGQTHRLARYWADWDQPRPESYREDVAVASCLESDEARRCLYRNIASAAESGWDFSSRWCLDGCNLATMRTTQIVPADLQGFLCLTARHISRFAEELGEASTAATFARHAEHLAEAMDELMWNPETGCWHDLLLTGSTPIHLKQDHLEYGRREAMPDNHVSTTTPPSALEVATEAAEAAAPEGADSGAEAFAESGAASAAMSTTAADDVASIWRTVQLDGGMYASNWVPLWCGCCKPGSSRALAAVRGLRASGLIGTAGVMTSLYPTGHQWDAPNAWAPLQHMIISGLRDCGVPDGELLAAELASSWIKTNMEGYRATGHMHEKYSAVLPGGAGGGGEYAPQVGFGWSNGVLLDLLRLYPDQRCKE